LSVLRGAVCLLLGAAVAIGALAVHRMLVPAGLVLALGTTFGTAWWLRATVGRAAVLYVAGWLAVLVVAVVGRPEGDYVIANDIRGWCMLAAALGLVVVGLVSLAGGGLRDT
jgi:hypothetical protein